MHVNLDVNKPQSLSVVNKHGGYYGCQGNEKALFFSRPSAWSRGGRFRTKFARAFEISQFLHKERIDSNMLGAKL